jgi:hypothetical protein
MSVHEIGRGSAHHPQLSLGKYEVVKAGVSVYRFSCEELNPGDTIRLISSGRRWVLEYTDHVVIDGVDVGRKYGYQGILGHFSVGGRDAYVVKKSGRFRVCYDGRLTPEYYDRVVHYLYGEPSCNIRGGDNGVRFYAVRNGYWYRVVAELD